MPTKIEAGIGGMGCLPCCVVNADQAALELLSERVCKKCFVRTLAGISTLSRSTNVDHSCCLSGMYSHGF